MVLVAGCGLLDLVARGFLFVGPFSTQARYASESSLAARVRSTPPHLLTTLLARTPRSALEGSLALSAHAHKHIASAT